MEVFEKNCESFVQQGYKKTQLTIDIVKANIIVLVLAIPVIAIGVLLFLWQNPASLLRPTLQESILFFILCIVLIVVHELLHGLTWSIFTEHHFKDVEFGIL